jgi:purine-binding chemotaxis protein CheW
MNQPKEILTFELAGEIYGVDILCVQEIRVWSKVTVLPDKPDYIKGVINLRGVIVPIIDLRQRFHLPVKPYTDKTIVIILRQPEQSMNKLLGIVVDAVVDVYQFYDEQLKSSPDFGQHIDNRFISGLIDYKQQLIIAINCNALLNQDELYRVESNNMVETN